MKTFESTSVPENIRSEGLSTPLVCTITQLATTLQVPVKTIYYWVHRKQIPFVKMGRHLRFNPTDVLGAFVAKTAGEGTPCFGDRPILKDPGRRSLKIRNANPAQTKE